MLTLTLPLSLSPNTPPLRIPVAQNDSQSRTLIFRLTAPSGAPNLPDGAIVTMDGTKPDGKSFSHTGTLANDRATVTLTRQMCAVAGEVACQLTITHGDEILGSARFFLMVQEAAIPTDPDLSDSELTAFQELRNQAPGWVSAASESAAAAANSASAAASVVETHDQNLSAHATLLAGKANICPAAAPGNLAGLGTHGQLMDLGFRVNVGTWTPVVSGAKSYSSQIGTYCHIGNLAILQFSVYGSFGGDVTKKISITGCPITPESVSGGGGTLSGYTAAANVVFAGWSLSSAGVISPVGQETGTSASHKYSSDQIFEKASGDFSASGTIAVRMA